VQRLQFMRQWRYLARVVHPARGARVWTWIADMQGEPVAAGVKAWQDAGVEAVDWDRARSHRSTVVKGVGVRLVEQPPYAPEVQPAERIFEELRREVDGVIDESVEAKIAAVERELHAAGGRSRPPAATHRVELDPSCLPESIGEYRSHMTNW
jgi:hypothetical protein